MGEMRLMRLFWTGVAPVSVLLLSACTGECGEPPPLVAATYMERVNCDLGGECVYEDEMDMVMVEPDPQDASRFEFTSVLRGLNAQAVFVCGPRAEYQVAVGADRLEEGTMIFSENPDTYTRTANITDSGESGACTGNASKVGPAGPPEAVGTCPNPGGSGGAGGSGGGTGGGGGCEAFSTDVGGTESAPVLWEERYTCITSLGECLGEENIEVALALIQDAQRIDWSIAEGTGQGSEYAGDLCDTSFRWTSKPGTESEEGCWEFTETQFNKRSFGASFFCVGAGSKGDGSTPAALPSCEEIAAANVDYEACRYRRRRARFKGTPRNATERSRSRR